MFLWGLPGFAKWIFLHVANGKSTMTWEWIKGIVCCFGANLPQANPNHVQFHDFHGKKHIKKHQTYGIIYDGDNVAINNQQ